MAKTTKKRPKKWKIVTPKRLVIGELKGDVVAWVQDEARHFGLPSDTGLMLRMTPGEARKLAQRLIKWADAAGTKTSLQ